MSAQRVLYIASDSDDYQSDALFHGLRSVLGERVVDIPRRDQLYRDYPETLRRGRYGRGFTLYGLLDDIPLDRTSTWERLGDGEYDLVVIGDIWRCWGAYVQFARFASQGVRFAVVDGADAPAPYPYAGRWWRDRRSWLLPRAHTRVPYFKRELTPETRWFRSFLTTPPPVARRLGPLRNMHPISFGIPEQHVVDAPPPKTKDFTAHVIDPEVAARVGGATSYAFEDQDAYYADLRASRFGVTIKREGWDALRHYELAAAGLVLCFRDLDAKPRTCAPHGLDRSNCLVYRDADDLLRQIDALDDTRYAELQHGSLTWARANTTRALAERFLRTLEVS